MGHLYLWGEWGYVKGNGEERGSGPGWPIPVQLHPGAPSTLPDVEAAGPAVGLGRAGLGSAPTAEAAFLSSAAQTDSVASAPTSKPSSSSPPRDSLTPGPGPSSAIPLRPPPAKAPSTDTVSECPGTARGQLCCDSALGLGWREAGSCLPPAELAGPFCSTKSDLWPTGAPLLLPHTWWAQTCRGWCSGLGQVFFFCFSLTSCHFSGAA